MNHDCADCGVNTWMLDEMYMIRPELWNLFGAGKRMLCIGCLENRMERFLVADDFTGAPINTDLDFARSGRLQDRLAA